MVQIHTLRAEEVKASEVSLADNTKTGVLGLVEPFPEYLLDEWGLISDSAKDFYKDLDTLFTDLQPRNKKARRLHADFVPIVEPFDNTIGLGKYTHRPGSSSKRTPSKFLPLLDARLGVGKKAGTILERPAKFDGVVVGRGVIKGGDHG